MMEKILLVDDVRLFLEIQRGFLEDSKVEVFVAHDGKEALDIAERELPNLIMMDKYMPVMDGVSCCKAIRAHKRLQHIPVVLLSNDYRVGDFNFYKDEGFSDCLTKPIDKKLFLLTAKKYLNSLLRCGLRVPHSTAIYLSGNDSSPVGKMIDISVNGLCMESKTEVTQGAPLNLSFAIPGNDTPIEVIGKVAWKNTSGGVSKIGIEFIEIVGKGIPFIRKTDLKSFISSSTV